MRVKQEISETREALKRKKDERQKRVKTMGLEKVRVGLLDKPRDPQPVLKHQPRALVTRCLGSGFTAIRHYMFFESSNVFLKNLRALLIAYHNSPTLNFHLLRTFI